MGEVMVTGATGGIGQALVAALVAVGHQVSAVGHDPDRLRSGPGVRAVAADLAENGTPTIPAECGRCPGQARRAAPRSPGCGGQRWRRNRLPMYRPQHTRQTMMIKTMNMARSFGEPGATSRRRVFPGFCSSAYAGNKKLAILF